MTIHHQADAWRLLTLQTEGMNRLEAIVAEICAEAQVLICADAQVLSVVLVGSAARDQMDQFSDLDFHVVVRGSRPQDRMWYRDGRLVNINFVDTENREAMFSEPSMAIWNILPAREARILFDPEHWYAALQRRAWAFTWQQIEQRANLELSRELASSGEEAHKVLSGLAFKNLEKALFGTTYLVMSLARVGALANRVLVNSENHYWSSVREAQSDQAWKTYFWTALGFGAESVTERAESALRLYLRSAELFAPRLLPEHQAIVLAVTQKIAQHLG